MRWGTGYDPAMVLFPEVLALLQAPVARDTIVTLTMPAQTTAFDYVNGTLQLALMVVGLVALVVLILVALTLRKSVQALQATVDRLTADAKPLLYQATRTSEDVRDVVKVVRREVDRLAETSNDISDRLRDMSSAAEQRVDQANALLAVMQDEVEKTTISAAATMRGVRVGAVALGAALAGRAPKHDTADDEDMLEDALEDDELEDEELDDDFDEDDEDEDEDDEVGLLDDELDEELDDLLDDNSDADKPLLEPEHPRTKSEGGRRRRAR